jgi:hypothetical protein
VIRGLSLSVGSVGFAPRGGAEAGLFLTSQYDPNNNLILDGRSDPVVFAVDFVGLTDAPGLVFEYGGTGTGAYVGFGSTNEFIVRSGDGGVRWPVNTGYILETTTKPTGDGTLVWEFTPGTPISVRAWWNGVAIGTPVDGGTESSWAGSNQGTFLATSTGNIPSGESDGSATYTTASKLRHYENQVSSL